MDTPMPLIPTTKHVAIPTCFIQPKTTAYAGTHLILDIWGASRIDNAPLMESMLREGAEACRATLLDVNVHQFDPHPSMQGQDVPAGVTGVAMLAESHISVHTWPENGFAAFDIFVCGESDPYPVVPIIERYFTPESINISTHHRGLIVRN